VHGYRFISEPLGEVGRLPGERQRQRVVVAADRVPLGDHGIGKSQLVPAFLERFEHGHGRLGELEGPVGVAGEIDHR
jgi:hypothetical protein